MPYFSLSDPRRKFFSVCLSHRRAMPIVLHRLKSVQWKNDIGVAELLLLVSSVEYPLSARFQYELWHKVSQPSVRCTKTFTTMNRSTNPGLQDCQGLGMRRRFLCFRHETAVACYFKSWSYIFLFEALERNMLRKFASSRQQIFSF